MPVKRYSAPTVCMAAHAAMFFIRSIVVDLLSLPTVEPPKVLEARTIWPRDLLSGSGGKESGMAISLSSREWLHGPNGSAGFTNVSIYIPSSNRTARQRFIQEKKKDSAKCTKKSRLHPCRTWSMHSPWVCEPWQWSMVQGGLHLRMLKDVPIGPMLHPRASAWTKQDLSHLLICPKFPI